MKNNIFCTIMAIALINIQTIQPSNYQRSHKELTIIQTTGILTAIDVATDFVNADLTRKQISLKKTGLHNALFLTSHVAIDKFCEKNTNKEILHAFVLAAQVGNIVYKVVDTALARNYHNNASKNNSALQQIKKDTTQADTPIVTQLYPIQK